MEIGQLSPVKDNPIEASVLQLGEKVGTGHL